MKTYSRKQFYISYRKEINKKINQAQVDSLNAILVELEYNDVPIDQAAYILATAMHESRLTPVRESFASSNAQAISRLNRAYSHKVGTSKCYWCPDSEGKSWYGRGFVQLTWRNNYKKMAKMIDVDIVAQPDLALEPFTAAKILVLGMVRGAFTGKAVGDYKTHLYRRRVVNGMDKAKLFASTARKFEKVLNAAVVEEDILVPPIDSNEPPAASGYTVSHVINDDGTLTIFVRTEDHKEGASRAVALFESQKELQVEQQVQTKHALKSRTIWGVVLGVLTVGLPPLFQFMGYNITQETAEALGQHGMALTQLLLGIAAAGLTTHGRHVSSQGIHWLPKGGEK